MLHLCRVLQVLLILCSSLVWAVRPSHDDDADDASEENEARVMEEACKHDHEGEVGLKDLRACVGTLQQYANTAKTGLDDSLNAEQKFVKEYREAAKQLAILRTKESLAKKMEADHHTVLNVLLEDAAEAESKAKSLKDNAGGKDGGEEAKREDSAEKNGGKAHAESAVEEEERTAHHEGQQGKTADDEEDDAAEAKSKDNAGGKDGGEEAKREDSAEKNGGKAHADTAVEEEEHTAHHEGKQGKTADDEDHAQVGETKGEEECQRSYFRRR